jgi:hypothetical protein
MVKNREKFKSNSEIHSTNTRDNKDFHYPTCNLTVFQKGTYYFGIKAFNNLSSSIKNLSHDTKQFSFALNRFLLHFTHWKNILTSVLINDLGLLYADA